MIALSAISEFGSQALQSFHVPKDLRTALKRFHLEPSLQTFVCCPQCFALYTPDAQGDFQNRCDYRTSSTSAPCGAELKKPAGRKPGQPIPHRVYQHQSLCDWWGRMLTRPGVEKAADEYMRTSRVQETASDIWDAKRLHRMEFKDGHKAGEGPKEIGRYVFSLAIDWFLVDDAKAGRTKRSVGAIYACSQSLPPHLRYLSENMCLVGIIPGPKKTHGHTLNHFLHKVVDDLIKLRDGTWYTKTHQYPLGRLVYGLLGPVIADLDAARIIGGFAGHQHHKLCHCCHIDRADIRNFDPSMFNTRTHKDHVEAARRWKEATTDARKRAIYDSTGVFWTPLQRLEYWDPTTDLIIDVMHNQFLGLAQEHCRRIWGMNMKVKGGQGTAFVLQKIPSKADMVLGWAALQSPTEGREKELKGLSKDTLIALCSSCSLMARLGQRPVKADMVNALHAWVSEVSLSGEALTTNPSSPTKRNSNNPTQSVAPLDIDYARLLKTDRTRWYRLPKDLLLRCCQYEAKKIPEQPKDQPEPIMPKPDFDNLSPTQLAEWLLVSSQHVHKYVLRAKI